MTQNAIRADGAMKHFKDPARFGDAPVYAHIFLSFA